MVELRNIKALMNLKGRTALVTGSSGGLGKIISSTLAELGADLLLVDQPSSNGDIHAQEMMDKWGTEITYFSCDLEQEEDRDTLINNVIKKVSKLDILINNAAFVGTTNLDGWATDFENQSLNSWRAAMEVNLTAIFHLVKKLVPVMKTSQAASIINICSIYGLHGPDWELYENTNMSNPAAYGVSKAGLMQLSRWLATTLAPNIRVNSISPGGISRGQNQQFIDRYCRKTPLGRMATENDIAGAITFLATDLSEYVTGQNIIIDGGFGVW